MVDLDYGTLLEEIKSPQFDSFRCVNQLSKYCDNLGVHHALVKKLYTYSYDEVEFIIPQLIQILVSFETDSMALEEFILDYSSKYPHFSLIVFWNLQAYVFELRNDPNSYAFETVRKFINKLQNLLFNSDIPIIKQQEFRENLHPAIVLCGVFASSIGLPAINEYAAPLIKSQAKQEKSFVFKLANFQKALTKNLTMKNQRLSTEVTTSSHSDDENHITHPPTGKTIKQLQRASSLNLPPGRRSGLSFLSDDSETYTTDDDVDGDNRKRSISIELKRNITKTYTEVEENLRINTIIKSKKSQKSLEPVPRKEVTNLPFNSHSMPDLSRLDSPTSRPSLYLTESESYLENYSNLVHRNFSERIPNNRNTSHSYNKLLKTLKVNYAKKETEFIISLQNISLRLSQVPREARLSALRAELSILNETLLPSEIDIPQLLPITSNKYKKYHKILKLNINEACVLNSAERVPFLLLIEYLSDEIDFNPFSEYNQKIINNQKTSHEVSVETENDGDVSELDIKSPESIRTSSENMDEASITGIHVEADLSDIAMLSQRSSSHNLEKLKNNDTTDRLVSKLSLDETKTKRASPIPNTSPDIPTKVLADQMRIASVMLQQLQTSGKSSTEQSASIRNRIVDSMIALQDQFDSIDYEKLNQLTGDREDAGERKLENDFKLSEDWNTKKARIRSSSIYGHLDNWDLCSVIAKNGDDLPQEAFACQLITMISNIWKKKNVGAWTKRMKILITSANTGLVETITNAISIHSIKKSLTEISIKQGENAKGRIFTLQDYFEKIYGSADSPKYKQAQNNFARSLASYSVICYILQIKDRHNGNIMLDNEGHIIHIDFGFLLSNSPGSVGFEAAPFKLTTEYVDLLGGLDSVYYKNFKDLCKKCFIAIREESEQIINIVELMQKDSTLPCFKNGDNTSVLLKQRLQPQLSDSEIDNFVEYSLIGKSLGSMYTRLYDQFQMVTQGIYS